MPCPFRIHEDLHLLRVRYEGNVTLEEHRALETNIIAEPAFRVDLMRLSDCSRLTETDLGLTDFMPFLDRLQARVAGVEGRIRWAILAPSDLSYGMAHMWRSLLESSPTFDVRIFSDVEELLEFLDLDRPGMAEMLELDHGPTSA
ncbi:hypothetical protein [Tropicimonas sediminicola]|uniref:SpoIIAA-like n=1 Tax=Tropicimonas sediminicola TaxID=1031541 RepID=A0A239C6H8_9RHOB|nr:hypothetical protein [Tropicimonas sediminicola]SNS15875.1 hypothetical protein SAMN05421757_101122 [Tropicimonas sediminicola]